MEFRTVPLAVVGIFLALALAGCGSGGGGGDNPAKFGDCGKDSPSPVAECQNPDFGSCGNACCNLMVTIHQKTPGDIVAALTDAVKGAADHEDGKFALGEMADGTKGFNNLTQASAALPLPWKGSKSIFMAQVHHTTQTGYEDVININMWETADGSSAVHAFSTSLVAGALGDNGQNYKNIMMLLSGMNFTVTEHLNNSCPSATQFVQTAPAVDAPRMLSSMDKKHVEAPAASPEAAIVGSCGGKEPSSVKDCQNVDLGSCGNACCSLLIHQAYEPAKAMQRLKDKLSNGGPDGDYTLQKIHGEGPPVGFVNITNFLTKLPPPFNMSTSPDGKEPFWGLYLGQVHHMTSGPKHYNDTIDFTIYKTDDNPGSLIRVTSTSLIGGALGDNGQNYKNIMMAMDAAFGNYHTVKDVFFNSCPAAAAQVLV